MKKIYIPLICLAVLGLILFSIKENTETSTQTASSIPIKIGAVISLTGPAASFGEYAKNGMELAVSEINSAGGIDGRKVEITYEDDRTDPKDAVSGFKKLVSINKVQGVIGGLWDFVAQPLFPLALENKVVFITPSNLRIKGEFEANTQSFIMLPEFKKVLQNGEEFLKRDDVKKIAVVHFKSVFGEEVARSFNEMTNAIGKGPMINESYSQLGSNDFKTTIAKLKQQNVDTVFLDMVDVDTVNFLRRAKELDFNPKFITYVGSYDAFAEDNKYLLEGITVLDWEFSKESFATRYQKMYRVMPSKSAQRSYDAVYILAEAISKSTDVAGYIETHSFVTPNSTVKFLSTHEVDSADVELKMYKGGTLVLYQK